MSKKNSIIRKLVEIVTTIAWVCMNFNFDFLYIFKLFLLNEHPQ